mmetsp:Transcript_2199/g.4181  ORF Transcript_2199/g.4181 Transcript_2199/m.4181 type:complete len:258 (+) Transcript_2199:206-979(+)
MPSSAAGVGANTNAGGGVASRPTSGKIQGPSPSGSKKASTASPNSASKKSAAARKKADANSQPQPSKDEDLNEIEESCTTIDDKEDDVLFTAKVNEEEEISKMMVPTTVINMTPAERELADWRATHVLSAERAKFAVKAAGLQTVPRMQPLGVDKENVIAEYLSRGFQELLSTMVPDLIDIARHRVRQDSGSYGPNSATNEKATFGRSDSSNESQPKTIEVKPEDLDLYCGVTRTLAPKLDAMLGETLLDLLGDGRL